MADDSPLPFVTVSAPMVRYSRLPFRLLCRRWGTDLAFTPMLIADSFVASAAARDADLCVCAADRPLAVQFAARDDVLFGRATELVAQYCDVVDLNCGCPQGWAVRAGFGCALKTRPQLVADCVRRARNALDGAHDRVRVSVKMRVDDDVRQTVEFARRAAAAGAAFLTVHGRTEAMGPGDAPRWDAVAAVCSSVPCPVVLNGGVASRGDARRGAAATGAAGVMAGRGLLANPALFRGAGERGAAAAACGTELAVLSLALGLPVHLFRYHALRMAPRSRAIAAAASAAGVVDAMRGAGMLDAAHLRRLAAGGTLEHAVEAMLASPAALYDADAAWASVARLGVQRPSER